MSTKKLRSTIKKTPLVGSAARLAQANLRLPEDMEQLKTSITSVSKRLQTLENNTETNEQNIFNVDAELNALKDTVAYISNRVAELEKNPAVSTSTDKTRSTEHSSSSIELFADDHRLDSFYVAFEDKFRGTEEEITDKLKIYLPLLKSLTIDLKKYPIIDIGCGRGEMLTLMKSQGYKAKGVDINEEMVVRAKSNGLDVIQADAITYLEKQKSGSLGVISGFHIVEHIPFSQLLRLFSAAYRALTPGGIVIFETPNPENIIVGSCNFYHDPSHLNPIPPTILQFELQTQGFEKAEIMRLQPMRENIQHDDELVKAMAERMFGAQDYSVIGRKRAI